MDDLEGFDFQEFFENINGNAQLHVHVHGYLIHLGYMFIFQLSSITFWTSLKSVGERKNLILKFRIFIPQGPLIRVNVWKLV